MTHRLLLILGLILVATPSHAGGSEAQSQQLATTRCSSGEDASLSLEKGPSATGGFGEREVTFRLTASPPSFAEEQRLLWQGKTILASKVLPWPYWRASLVCDEVRDRILLTLVLNQGVTTLVLDVFAVPLGVEAERQPLTIEGPVPYAPVISPGSEVHYEGRLPVTSDGLESVDSELRDNVLAVTLHFRSKDVVSLDLIEVDLTTGEVREIGRAAGEE